MNEFLARNRHLPGIHRFSAVEGASLNRDDLVAAGVLSDDLRYTPGALGCAMSHHFFWGVAVKEGTAITVCEDDAIFHQDFDRLSEDVIHECGADWDLVMWGWNFDSILYYELLPGVSPSVAQFDQLELRNSLERFQALPLAPHPYPLLRSFGTVAYSVSPQGASRLLERCFPLRPQFVDFPGINPAFPNTGIDIAMNACYADIRAFVCMPPLVVTKNEHEVSTVR